MADAQTLPGDVRAALLRDAKTLVLAYYTDGRRCLRAWDGFFAHMTTVQSFTLPGSSVPANLRRLKRLAQAGVLVERENHRKGAVRIFTATRPALDEIGAQAVREWEAVGYRIGVTMPEIKRKRHDQ